jgi:hypothetical protein
VEVVEPESLTRHAKRSAVRSLRYLANSAEGRWWFKNDDDGTKVRWTYTFRAKNWFISVPLALFVRMQWVGYMLACIRNVGGQFRNQDCADFVGVARLTL